MQENMLQRIDEFARKNKVRWGQEKCKVMPVGKKEDHRNEWQFGDIAIGNCDEYKYLGDVITCDGKNHKNIEARKTKMQSSTIQITSVGSNETLRGIQASTLIRLHETMNLPKLLINSETWILTKGNRKELDKIETQCLKRLFSLPSTTPTAAIIFSYGVLFTSVNIDKKQLIYLHRMLSRPNEHWTLRLLYESEKLNTGWTPQIRAKLAEYGLEENFDRIKSKSRQQWKKEVEARVEKINQNRLRDECYETKMRVSKAKTKTTFVLEYVDSDQYKRDFMDPIQKLNRYEAKVLILSRFHMLECGKNYKGTLPESCPMCNVSDDEHHRLNHCVRYRSTNLYECAEKLDFDNIYKSDFTIVRKMIDVIGKVWNMRTGQGSMVQTA